MDLCAPIGCFPVLVSVEGRRPLASHQKDVDYSLRRPCGSHQCKRHASKLEKTMMRCKRSFVLSFFRSFDLPISAVGVKGRKLLPIAKEVNSFVHAWYLVRVPDPHSAQLTVVYAKRNGAVLFRDKDNSWGALWLNRFDNVRWQHSIYFLLLEFSHLRTCTVWGWMNGLAIFSRLIWCCIALIERSFLSSRAFELCNHVIEFVSVFQTLVW